MRIAKIVIVIPMALLIISLLLGSSLLFRLFVLSLLVLLLSYGWTWFAARGIRVHVGDLPEHSKVGARFDREIAVFNDSRLPRYLVNLEEEADLPGYHHLLAVNLPPKGSFKYQSRVDCWRRGRYHLGATILTARDPLGLFQEKRRFGESRELLVFPATIELPFFEASAPSNLGDGSSNWLIGGSGPNASSVREFAWGDSLTHIHWPSTAHAGRLMVKVFESDRSPAVAGDVHVILDLEGAAHAGEGNEGTEEYAVTIAASLVKKYVDSGMSAGLIASSDPACVFAPARGEGHLDHIMEALALVSASGKVSVERVIANEMKRIGNNAAVIIVTPAMTSRLVDTIRQLKARGNLVAIVWLEAASFGGTSSLPAMGHSVNQMGIRTYLIRKGDDLARTLNQHTPVPVRYA